MGALWVLLLIVVSIVVFFALLRLIGLLLGIGAVENQLRVLNQSLNDLRGELRRASSQCRTATPPETRSPAPLTDDAKAAVAAMSQAADALDVATCDCGFAFKILPSMRGRQGKCPKCGVLITVPA